VKVGDLVRFNDSNGLARFKGKKRLFGVVLSFKNSNKGFPLVAWVGMDSIHGNPRTEVAYFLEIMNKS